MSERAISIPGPHHPITTEVNPNRVVVTVNGAIIADSTEALTLREADYPPVQYIPRKDVRMGELTSSNTKSHCPYKGEATYFSIKSDGDRSHDAIWTYEAPYGAVSAIKDYLAFYADRVDGIEERPV
jgi:uncharacterized protein (DUF427 family)